MCKRLEQVVNNVMLIADAVEILTDEKYFNAFEKYDVYVLLIYFNFKFHFNFAFPVSFS